MPTGAPKMNRVSSISEPKGSFYLVLLKQQLLILYSKWFTRKKNHCSRASLFVEAKQLLGSQPTSSVSEFILGL